MRFFIKLSVVGLLALCLLSCSNKTSSPIVQESISTYDPLLAEKVGADEYGMKTFVVAFLKRGPNRDLPEDKANDLQRAHMDNINKLAEEGKLVLAGPFYGDSDLSGIYIFNVETIEEAKALTNTDPAIQQGSLVMELHKWYGSAATVLINDWHSKIQKTEI